VSVTEALRRLHEAGRVRSPWLPGMSYVTEGRYIDTSHASPRASRIRPIRPPKGAVEPDHTDPCTAGGLLSLLREASGANVCTRYCVRTGWRTPLQRRGYPTEGEALAAALVALAEAL
jgi:hypothetical protein